MIFFKKSLAALSVLVLFSLIFPLPASAQEAKTATQVKVKMAIINIDEIRRNAAVVKDILRQIKTLRNAYQKDIQKEEEELRIANQELSRQRSILSPDAFVQERRKFEQRLGEVQRLVQNRKQDLERVRGDALRQVEVRLNKIVIDIANKDDITLVLKTQQLIFWAKPLEITAKVLKQLDAVMPTIKISKPAKSPKKK